MTTAADARTDTRARLLTTALRLFTEHGVEGTSLQMIADALGFTKAAVYYHFKTKDEITEAVSEPALHDLGQLLDEAGKLRRHGPRVEFVLSGLVDLVLRHRALLAVFCTDPGVARAIDKKLHGEMNLLGRIQELLGGEEADPDTVVAAHVALAGVALAGASPALASFDDETLRASLLNAARRVLGRRRRD